MKGILFAALLAVAATAQAEPRIRAAAPVVSVPPCERFAGRLPNVQKALCESAQLKAAAARSVNGVPIYTRDIQAPGAKLRVLVTGAIHGDELSSSALAFHWIRLASQEAATPLTE